MGCGGSKEPVEDGPIEESAESRALNEMLDKQQKEENAIIKLLVLGTGESGKSTVFKQMKILYSVPDPPSKFTMVCRANLFGNAHSVHAGMKKLGIEYGSESGEKAGALIIGKPADGNVDVPDEALVAAFAQMYEDTGVIEAIERAAEYQLNDSTKYFWERSKEILKPDYIPTEQDVLRARVRTTGIVQQNFQIGTSRYTMFDVGGQRNERRKWIHCFDNVTAVIFVTAISEYDQVLYEDENTNRMDEALTLFDQICNHPSFSKTSMILFLNKRDLFEAKLQKKDLTCWDPTCTTGHNYDASIDYIKQKFINKNKAPELRQVYVHATCATDTTNVSAVMNGVFDIILKENLRKMGVADIDKMADLGPSTGKSGVVVPPTYATGTIILCSCWFVETLKDRKVLAEKVLSKLPGVEMAKGGCKAESEDFLWIMGLGKEVPKFAPPIKSEIGSFRGNFKEAATQLRSVMGTDELGFVYDQPIYMKSADITYIVCVKAFDTCVPKEPLTWVDFEVFENANLKAFCGVDTDANPCKAPNKNEEFNPFAANPVGSRWFKGVTLYTAQVSKTPDKGVYLGIMKVLSGTTGFSIMVNEHNRINIPLIFLTCTQLTPEELTWLAGVRIRQNRGIDLLEGKKPNRGWLGPEMSGEEGATFPEKLWWAIDEAKARLDTEDLGSFYDAEALDVDENNNIQLVLYACMAKDEGDILPGHVWVDRKFLETQNMKYFSPTVLGALLADQAVLMAKYIAVEMGGNVTPEQASALRAQKEGIKKELDAEIKKVNPLKWINRVIMWTADKMPSFGDKVPGCKDMEPAEVVAKALEMDDATKKNKAERQALITKYLK